MIYIFSNEQMQQINSGWCRYNWQQFSVVTSDVAGHDDFVQVSDHLLPLALVSKIYMSSAAESSAQNLFILATVIFLLSTINQPTKIPFLEEIQKISIGSYF